MNNKEILNAATVITNYCESQRSCQNCIFRKYGVEHWNCHIYAFDLQNVLNNIEAKKKNHGWL